eukprot:5993823-Pyramimonas_sp.AAC.1
MLAELGLATLKHSTDLETNAEGFGGDRSKQNNTFQAVSVSCRSFAPVPEVPAPDSLGEPPRPTPPPPSQAVAQSPPGPPPQ